jgi:hypothetical protein
METKDSKNFAERFRRKPDYRSPRSPRKMIAPVYPCRGSEKEFRNFADCEIELREKSLRRSECRKVLTDLGKLGA